MAIFIPEDKISEIKNTADIVDIVSESVILKKTGKNYVGLCPFHAEKTPSFTVSPEKQIFHCFGCGTGGNVFSFLMKQEGLSFPETVRMIARRYGIEIPTQKMSPEQKRRISEKERLLAVNQTANDYFRRSLTHGAAGKTAMKYLNEREIAKKSIDDFQLGYAPGGWDNLTNIFFKKKIAPALAEKAGLIVSRKNRDGFYDRFRNRIIFPIYSVNMQLIGFGGRVLDDAMPKYLNSPETPLYNKSRSLYGIHRAKQPCRQHNTVYIVEGYFDLLALHQHGIENTVATLGTSLTPEHVRLLKGYAATMIMVYDSDEAGVKAVLRSIGTFKKEKVDARILVLPEGYDPDAFIMKFGLESFTKIASDSKGIMSFLIDSTVKQHGLSNQGKVRIVQELKKPFSTISDKVEGALFIKELAECIGVDEAAVNKELRTIPAARKDAWSASRKQNEFKKWDRLEQQIIKMMLQYPQILPEIKKKNILDLFNDDGLRSIGKMLLALKNDSQNRISDILSLIDDDEKRNLVSQISMVEDSWNQKNCLNILTRFVLSRRKNEKTLHDQIKAAEKANDLELVQRLLGEKHKRAVLSDKQKMALKT